VPDGFVKISLVNSKTRKSAIKQPLLRKFTSVNLGSGNKKGCEDRTTVEEPEPALFGSSGAGALNLLRLRTKLKKYRAF